MVAYEGVEVDLNAFLTSAVGGGERYPHVPAALLTG
jgi:hypothetical protein